MWRLPLLHVVIMSDVLRANTFYKPTLGPKYVSKRPYNEFITLTAFIWPMIGIFNGFPFPIFCRWVYLGLKVCRHVASMLRRAWVKLVGGVTNNFICRPPYNQFMLLPPN